MIAGFVLFSAVIGMLVMGAAFALSLPLWIAVIAYPAISSLTLLLCAALWSIRDSGSAASERLHPQHLPS